MKPHRPYELSDYDPSWKEMFATTAKKLRPILADNLVEIEHIGSTSIPGMVAKPQIDVLVVVKDLDEIPAAYGALKRAGFTPRGRGYVNPDDEYLTEDAPDGRRIVSVHTLQAGNQRIEEYKLLRDYLMVREADRERYIETKRKLYATHSENYAAYDSGKKDTIDAIKVRAKAWAASQPKQV